MVRRRGRVVAVMFVLVIAALSTVWSPASSGQAPNKPAVTTWEYKTFFGTAHERNDKELNSSGRDGWVLSVIAAEGNGVVRFVLKRPIAK